MSPTAQLITELLRPIGVAWGDVDPLHVALLVLARVTPLTVLAPLFLLRPAPALVRAGVALVLTLALVPLGLAHLRVAIDPLALPLLLVVEVLRGALFAVAVALPLLAIEGAGQWLDALRGAQNGSSSGPLFGGQSTPLGTLLGLLSVALFFTFGGHRVALTAFAAGLELVPIGAPLPGEAWAAIAERGMRWVAAALALTVSVAAPAALALALMELTLGLLGRTAPQIPLHFAGMPLRAAVGVAGLLLTLGVLVPHLPELFASGIDEGTSVLPLTAAP